MLKLLRAQLIKVFLRNDVKSVLIIFAVLPISISFLISIESGIIQIGDSVFTGMGYASIVVGLLNSLLLINVTMALIATSLVSKEIDCGLDSMYITKVKKRENIVVSKLVILDTVALILFAVLIFSAISGWFIFLKDSSFGKPYIFSSDRDENILLIYTIISSFLEIVVMNKIYVLFSMLFKYGKAVVFSFLTIVVFKLLTNIEQIRDWFPCYIGSGLSLQGYSGEELIFRGLRGIVLLIFYAAAVFFINYCIYKKMDLSR